MTKELRILVYDKLEGRCAYCGEEITYNEMQVDHIIPKEFFIWHIKNKFKVPKFLKHLTESDVNHIDNLFPACRVCNKWKAAHCLELFRSELKAQPDRLNERSSNYRIAKRYGMVFEVIDPDIVFYFEKINH